MNSSDPRPDDEHSESSKRRDFMSYSVPSSNNPHYSVINRNIQNSEQKNEKSLIDHSDKKAADTESTIIELSNLASTSMTFECDMVQCKLCKRPTFCKLNDVVTHMCQEHFDSEETIKVQQYLKKRVMHGPIETYDKIYNNSYIISWNDFINKIKHIKDKSNKERDSTRPRLNFIDIASMDILDRPCSSTQSLTVKLSDSQPSSSRFSACRNDIIEPSSPKRPRKNGPIDITKLTIQDIMKMSMEFDAMLVDIPPSSNPSTNRIIYKPPEAPPQWNPETELSQAIINEDDGYSTSNDSPPPSLRGALTNQQNDVMDLHNLAQTLKLCRDDHQKRTAILKSFIEEKTNFTMFLFIHSQNFCSGNESMLAKISLPKLFMILQNSLKLFELQKTPSTFIKNKWKPTLQPNRGYYYFSHNYEKCYEGIQKLPLDYAGKSKLPAFMYTEFTLIEITILVDAHLIYFNSLKLHDRDGRYNYIKHHSNQIYEWRKIIHSRINENKNVHYLFRAWLDIVLPIKSSRIILKITNLIFYSQFQSINDSLKKGFEKEGDKNGYIEYTNITHEKYYEYAIKGLNCKDFGIDKLYSREDDLWYTAFIGTYFNDIFGIKDGDLKAIEPFMKGLNICLYDIKTKLQHEYGNFYNLFSDTSIWEQLIEGKCQKIPRALNLYKLFASFILDITLKNPTAFDFTTHLIQPIKSELRKKLNALGIMIKENKIPSDSRHSFFIESIVIDLMHHLYPFLKSLKELRHEHTVALKLFTLHILKGFFIEWKEYNKWTSEKRRQRIDKKKMDINQDEIKKYFDNDFIQLPSNVLTAIWKRARNGRFLSRRVRLEFRKLLIQPQFNMLTGGTINSLFEILANLELNDIDFNNISKISNSDQLPEEISEPMDTAEYQQESIDMEVEEDNRSIPMELETTTSDKSVEVENENMIPPPLPPKIFSKPEVKISSFGLKIPSRIGSGRLSQWAFKNAEKDFKEKGKNFLLAPVNTQNKKENKETKQQPIKENCIPKFNFKEPLLKSYENKIREDYLQLYPEMQEWANDMIPMLEDMLSCKNLSDIFSKQTSTSTESSFEGDVTEDVIMEPSTSYSDKIDKNMQEKRQLSKISNENLFIQESITLCKFPVIAVCNEKESVIYELPCELLKNPKAENIFARHELKECDIWDYIQGKTIKISKNIAIFLCDIWAKTAKYYEKHKRAGTLNEFSTAQMVIRDMQNNKDVTFDEFNEKVIGVRFPYDLRKQKHLRNFCTLYIDANSLNFGTFKFKFDLKVSADKRFNGAYEIDSL